MVKERKLYNMVLPYPKVVQLTKDDSTGYNEREKEGVGKKKMGR